MSLKDARNTIRQYAQEKYEPEPDPMRYAYADTVEGEVRAYGYNPSQPRAKDGKWTSEELHGAAGEHSRIASSIRGSGGPLHLAKAHEALSAGFSYAAHGNHEAAKVRLEEAQRHLGSKAAPTRPEHQVGHEQAQGGVAQLATALTHHGADKGQANTPAKSELVEPSDKGAAAPQPAPESGRWNKDAHSDQMVQESHRLEKLSDHYGQQARDAHDNDEVEKSGTLLSAMSGMEHLGWAYKNAAKGQHAEVNRHLDEAQRHLDNGHGEEHSDYPKPKATRSKLRLEQSNMNLRDELATAKTRLSQGGDTKQGDLAKMSSEDHYQKATELGEQDGMSDVHLGLWRGKQHIEKGHPEKAEGSLMTAANNAADQGVNPKDQKEVQAHLQDLATKHGLHKLGEYVGRVEGHYVPSNFDHWKNPKGKYAEGEQQKVHDVASLRAEATKGADHEAYTAIAAAADHLHEAKKAVGAGDKELALKHRGQAEQLVKNHLINEEGDYRDDISPHAKALAGYLSESVGSLRYL